MLFDSGCVICAQTSGPVCGDCRSKLRPASPVVVPGIDCRVAFELNDQSRPIIAAFKYRRQRRLARWVSTEIAHLVPRCADAITWVPATPERRRSRGYDQAEELARALSRLTDVPARRLLRRDRNDVRQTGRTRSERLAGPALQAIAAPPRFTVLVDDVVTTGSSVRAAATALRAAVNPAETPRIVAVAAATTPASGDACLRAPTNVTSIRQWT